MLDTLITLDILQKHHFSKSNHLPNKWIVMLQSSHMLTTVTIMYDILNKEISSVTKYLYDGKRHYHNVNYFDISTENELIEIIDNLNPNGKNSCIKCYGELATSE